MWSLGAVCAVVAVVTSVPVVQQDARGVFANGAGFRVRVNVVERPSLKDREPDPNHKPGPQLFVQATKTLKDAWPAYEALFSAFLTGKHPYRSNFQAWLAPSSTKVTHVGEELQAITLERAFSNPMGGEDDFLVDPAPEFSLNLNYKDNPTYRFGDTILFKLTADFQDALPFLGPQVRQFCRARTCPTVEDLAHYGGGGQAFPWNTVAMLEAQGLDHAPLFAAHPQRAAIKTLWTTQAPVDPAFITLLVALEEKPANSNRLRADLLGELVYRLSPGQLLPVRDVLRDGIQQVEKAAPIPWVSTPIWVLKKLDYRAP